MAERHVCCTLHRPAVIAVLAVSIALAGCGREGTSAGDLATATDSAGILVIHNTAPVWQAGEEWHLEPEPTLDIGEEHGPPEVAFGYAHSPVRLSDGRIVVADMQTNRMYFYDSTGTYLSSAGGSGQGPGEFEQLYRLRRIAGDSLMALNPATLTSIFSPDGEFVRRFSLEPVRGRGNIWWTGYLEGGTLLALSLRREGTRDIEPPANPQPGVEYPSFDVPERHEFYRDTLLHFLYTMEGQMIDSVAKWPGQYLSENRVFAPNAAYAYSGDVIHHSPGDAVEIRSWRVLVRGYDVAASQDDAGAAEAATHELIRLERIVRRDPLRDLTVTNADREAHFARERARFEQMAAQIPDMDRAAMERYMLQQRFPERIPAHANRMYADPAGNLWLQEYDIDSTPGRATRWSVFDPDGRWLGIVDMPEGFTVNEIGTDYVLGVWRDELDVQYVRMYRLVKPRT